MKKFCAFLGVTLAACICANAFAATVLKPKKAAPVAKQETTTSTTNIGASMLPTAISMVSNVIALSQQQKALTADCYPSSSEITFVNNMVKEWANAGGANPVGAGKKIPACGKDGAKADYKTSVMDKINSQNDNTKKICWDVYNEKEARGAVWQGYPKAVVIEHCEDGDSNGKCKTKVKSSNMWDIFALISADFGDADYTKSESSQAAALRQKVSNCSDAKLAAKKKEMVGGFITSTIGNMGQTTNTATVMDSVQTIMGQKGLGGIGNLANIAVQFME